MSPRPSKLRRSLERGGPLGIALVLGAFLVASSALSYRDARRVAGLVAERQGVVLLRRIEAALGPRHDPGAAAAQATLEAYRALGLTYVALHEGHPGGRGPLLAEAGEPVLAGTAPQVGMPAVGHERVRMVSGGPGHFPGPGPRPFLLPPGPPFDANRPPPDFERPAPDFQRPPAPFDRPPRPRPMITIEFEPIASAEAVRRALTVLLLSSGAALLLAAAAIVLAIRAARAERDEAQLAVRRHLAQLGEMSAVLAHEIRNPLAALKGHAQLLGEQLTEPALAGRVARVVTEAIRLEQLTSDLLEFARSGAIDAGPADPAALVAEAIAATEPARVTLVADGAPARWRLDVERMRQVLVNLIDNALAVTPPPATVTVSLAVETDALVIGVRDRGPGVPAADRARIFEPFHTTKTRGTGLGLAVAQRIVALHGGHIDVGDAPDGGALFRVYLPR